MQVNFEDLCDHICGTSVGAVLGSVDIENCKEHFDFYLHDFVSSVHRCKHREAKHNDMEYQVTV